jgi:hypothetical protein
VAERATKLLDVSCARTLLPPSTNRRDRILIAALRYLLALFFQPVLEDCGAEAPKSGFSPS